MTPDNRRGVAIVFEAATESVLADPRLDRFEQFGEWLADRIELPGPEVIVECVDGATLPGRAYCVPEGSAVGCFCVRFPDGWAEDWRLAVALGPADEPDYLQEARLVTLAHELLHLSEFAAQFGRPPAIVALEGGWRELDSYLARSEGAEVEEKARHLTDRFLGYA